MKYIKLLSNLTIAAAVFIILGAAGASDAETMSLGETLCMTLLGGAVFFLGKALGTLCKALSDIEMKKNKKYTVKSNRIKLFPIAVHTGKAGLEYKKAV